MSEYNDQLEKFYEELQNDPEFHQYMEQKRREWMEDMDRHLIELQEQMAKGIDPIKSSSDKGFNFR